MESSLTVAVDFHSLLRVAATGWSEDTFTFNFHHAGAAVTIRAVTLFITKPWNI
jgi:hypothetical protein